jgi:hypothetical protein
MDKISKEFLELSEKITDVEQEPTLTVEGWFGKDKEVTRKEYIDLWVKNADLYKLVHYKQLAYMEAWVQDIKDDIAEIAGLSWDLGYNVQEEDKK